MVFVEVLERWQNLENKEDQVTKAGLSRWIDTLVDITPIIVQAVSLDFVNLKHRTVDDSC